MGLGGGRFDDAGADATNSNSIQFSTSLARLRRQAAEAQAEKDRMALGAGEGGSLPLVYETASPWDIWVEGRYSAFDEIAASLDRRGHVGVFYAGGDYRVAANVIVGALAQLGPGALGLAFAIGTFAVLQGALLVGFALRLRKHAAVKI
jgi:hypothetical protein